MSDENDTATVMEDNVVRDALPLALLFELEYVAVQGRKVMFDVYKSVLADRGVDLTALEYSRHCLGTPIEKAMTELLARADKGRVSVAKITREAADGIRLSLADKTLTINEGVRDILEAAGKDARLIAMTELDEETSTQIVGRLGLDTPGVSVFYCAHTGTDMSNADTWRQAAHEQALSPSRCLAIASTGATAHAAIAAGMNCIALSDSFTAHQDFGGADFIVDALDKATVMAAFELMGNPAY